MPLRGDVEAREERRYREVESVNLRLVGAGGGIAWTRSPAGGWGPCSLPIPRPVKALLRDWATDDDIWKRRTAILAQLRARRATDRKLPADVIRPSIGESELFLRKGIGWALRDDSKTDPDWVIEFVGAHPGLSSPSRREALKHRERTKR